MKITDVEVIKWNPGVGKNFIYIKLSTDAGITGWGEAYSQSDRDTQVETHVDQLARYLIDRDPFHIRHFMHVAHEDFATKRSAMDLHCALSGIEIAMWDIVGKTLGEPIYNLIGGPVRASVPLYTHIQDQGQANGLQDAYDQTKRVISEGYTAIKTDPFKSQRPSGPRHWGSDKVEILSPSAIQEAVDWMDTVREAAGPDAELMVDAHARFDTASAIAAGQALEHVNLIWYEEPVPPQNHAALQQVRENTNIPLCMGERHFTRFDYLPLFEHRLVDYVMPDILWTGGISEMKRIGSMAEAYYVRIAPHDAMGPVSIVAGFHCSMTMPNLYRLECLHTWFDDFAKILDPMFKYEGDSIVPTDEPGLGIALNHEVLDQYIVEPDSFISFG